MSEEIEKLFTRKAIFDNKVKTVPFYDFWTGTTTISSKKLTGNGILKLNKQRGAYKKNVK